VEVRNRLLVPTPRLIKRSMDLVLTVAGGVCVLPLIGVLALLVKFSSKGTIFYGHTRLGERGRKFSAWKFRSMVTNGEEILHAHLAADPEARAEWDRDRKLKNDPRLTPIGSFLRKTSLDELPQLWNVLKGEMSLVGPRPIVRAEIAKYGKCYKTYKAVRPGITGLWQVSGRNNTTYEERLRHDEFYVRNWSPWLDMHILARTVSTLVCGRGAY
jgi:Undecaprenyl-phosphate galactose phosphotransferase WbaP